MPIAVTRCGPGSTSSPTDSSTDPEAAPPEPIAHPTRRAGTRGARPQIGADHRRAQIIELGSDDPAIDPARQLIDEPRQPGILAEPEK